MILIPSQTSIQVPIPVLFSHTGLFKANKKEKTFHFNSTESTNNAIIGPIGKAAVNIVTYPNDMNPFCFSFKKIIKIE